MLTLKALANFTIFSTSKNKITNAIIRQVINIVFIGVRCLLWILVRLFGSSLSIAIAKGNLDDAKTPELAIEISVIIPMQAIV